DADEQRRVLLAVALGGARLARNGRAADAPERGVRGSVAARRRADQPVHDDLTILGCQAGRADGLRWEVADHGLGLIEARPRLEHGAREPRREERAAVRERGVPAGELERRDEKVALPDREAHVVARQPQRLLALLARVGLVLVELLLPELVGHATPGLVAQPDARRPVEAVLLGGVLDGVSLADLVVGGCLVAVLVLQPVVV